MKNKNNKEKFSNNEILIYGILFVIFLMVSIIFFPNNAFLEGLLPTLGLLIGLWIIKVLRKKKNK